MSLLDLQATLRGLNKDFEENNGLLNDWLYSINSVTVALVMNLSHGLDMAAEKMAEYIRQRDELMGAIDSKATSGWINQLKAEIKQLEEERALITKGSGQNIYDYYKDSIKVLQDQLDILLGKEKKQTKEKEKQLQTLIIQFRTAQEYWNWLQSKTGRDPRADRFGALDQLFALGDEADLPSAKGREDYYKRMVKQRMELEKTKKTMNEFNLALESGKIFADQLGNLLSSAFNGATISVQKFIEALIVAIAQMVILRAITSFLSPASSVSSGFIGPLQQNGMPKLSAVTLGKQTVAVDGKISMNSREFLVNLKSAETVMRANK